MINCYIIGEPTIAEVFKEYIDQFPLTVLKGHHFDLPKDLNIILNQKIEIIFVDISLIKHHKDKLLRIAQFSSIVFVAENKTYAYEAFEAFGFDYLIKSLSYERFEMSMNKFIHFSLLAPPTINKKKDVITDSFLVKVGAKGQKEILIKCSEVLFIEATQNHVVLHLVNHQKHASYNTLREMEESLPLTYFVRVHKSFIINYEKLTSIEGNYVILNESHKILIGNTYKKSFFERKNRIVIKKQRGIFSSINYSTTACMVFFLQLLAPNLTCLLDMI